MNEKEARIKIKEIEESMKHVQKDLQELRSKKKVLLLAIKTWKDNYENI